MKATKVGTEWHGKAMRKRDRQCKEPNLGVGRQGRAEPQAGAGEVAGAESAATDAASTVSCQSVSARKAFTAAH